MIPARPDEPLADVVDLRGRRLRRGGLVGSSTPVTLEPGEELIDLPLGDRGPASATLVVPDMAGATVLRGRHRRHVARGPALAARVRFAARLVELLDRRDRRHVEIARSALGRRR